MENNPLVDYSKEFAINIVNLCTELRESKKGMTMTSQILRSGTSIGANIHEANYAASRADFINKLQIALKECYETDYWLDILKGTKIITIEKYNYLFSQCSKIRRLLVASINTAKANQTQ